MSYTTETNSFAKADGLKFHQLLHPLLSPDSLGNPIPFNGRNLVCYSIEKQKQKTKT